MSLRDWIITFGALEAPKELPRFILSSSLTLISSISIRLKSHQLSHVSLFRSGQLRNDGDDNLDDEDRDSLGRSVEAHRRRRHAGVSLYLPSLSLSLSFSLFMCLSLSLFTIRKQLSYAGADIAVSITLTVAYDNCFLMLRMDNFFVVG